jgi:anti-anti-sigma factor
MIVSLESSIGDLHSLFPARLDWYFRKPERAAFRAPCIPQRGGSSVQFESVDLPGDIVQLKLVGRLDMDGTQAIYNKFTFATTTRRAKMIVDLSGVTFLASIGIRLLLTSAKAQATRGGKMILAAPQPMVRHVIEIAGIDKLVTLVEDVETARASFGG